MNLGAKERRHDIAKPSVNSLWPSCNKLSVVILKQFTFLHGFTVFIVACKNYHIAVCTYISHMRGIIFAASSRASLVKSYLHNSR